MIATVVQGAQVWNGVTQRFEDREVIVDGEGVVRSAVPSDHAVRHVDVAGTYLLPAVTDYHVHVYRDGSELGIDPDVYSFSRGVHTVVDCGSAGAYTLPAFARETAPIAKDALYYYLNLASGGIITALVGELSDLRAIDEAALLSALREHRDRCLGIKIRLSRGVFARDPEKARTSLQTAVCLAAEADLTVMAHVMDSPLEYAEIYEALRPGDIVTHVFSNARHSILSSEEAWEQTLAARAKGILFDVGCGRGGLDFDIAREALRRGFAPDFVSSDLSIYSDLDATYSLWTTVGKMLSLGMIWDDMATALTTRPNARLGRAASYGLVEDQPAAFTVVSLVEGQPEYVNRGYLRQDPQVMTGTVTATALLTVSGQRLRFGPGRLTVAEMGA